MCADRSRRDPGEMRVSTIVSVLVSECTRKFINLHFLYWPTSSFLRTQRVHGREGYLFCLIKKLVGWLGDWLSDNEVGNLF